MKIVRKKKSDPAKAINCRPGAMFGQQKTLETEQEALRVTVRDGMNQVKATWLQSLSAISHQRDLSSNRSPRLRGTAYHCS
ncbi:MAG TPA: hypothetical protein VLR90_12390, partial [Blastocatellia bacterium]|nr:hypothetical protein [Blastocatellia bacterium]